MTHISIKMLRIIITSPKSRNNFTYDIWMIRRHKTLFFQSVPLKISRKSIFINFGRKNILKIGNCREFDSEQLLYLKLVVKMCSYLSGNQRNFLKICENDRKSVLFFSELIFDFFLFKVFGYTAGLFFRFFVLLCRKIHFFVSNIAFFPKAKEIFTKSIF